MSIIASEIDKYTFNPDNPQECRSYKLLVKLAKRDALTYVGPNFVKNAFDTIIDSDNFREEILEIPKKYESYSIEEKIKLFIKDNSEKEFMSYMDSINIKPDKFIFNKIFTNLFDNTPYNYIKKMNSYSEALLKCKIINANECDFTGYKQYEDSYAFNEGYEGHKILFTNEDIFTNKSSYFFDVSSVLITTNTDLFIDSKTSEFAGEIIMRGSINKNIKPLFLKDKNDIKVLLEMLQKDLEINEPNQEIDEKEISTIDEIKIKNFYSIEDIKLEGLKDKNEIYIVGENGDGKSLILQAITTSLVGIQDGDVFDLLKSQEDAFLYIKDSLDCEYKKEDLTYPNIVAYGASRYSNCQMKKDEKGYLNLFNSLYDLKSPIDWLLYLDHNEKSKIKNVLSVSKAKELLNKLLNSDIEIDIKPDKVIFIERGSEVDFNQLSAGYKGVVTIVCDLIARLYKKQPYVKDIKDFRGIVIIDEVELHLHPKWKYEFMNKLRETFPLLQFIVTTHSPTVILGASKEAVFYKIYKEDGKISISNQILNEGYTNNTLVSSPLFDMNTITSRDYVKKDISSDDYIYEKIHQAISRKLENKTAISEDELLKYIDSELEKI